jgi:FkbM family methyltransferase
VSTPDFKVDTGRRSLARTVGSVLVGRLLPRGIPLPVVRGPMRGMWFILGSAAGDGGGASIYIGSSEPEQTGVVTRTLKEGQVLFDIGANVGYYTLLASRAVGDRGRVVAFEPFIRNVAFLARHVAMNHLSNVILMPYALSCVAGLTEFKPGRNNALGCLAGVGSERDAADRDQRSPSVAVPSTTLDDFVAHHGLVPDAVKIDVEGAELLVLQGARQTLRRRGPKIFLSTHTEALRRDCVALLVGEGYDLTPIGAPSLESASEFLGVRHGGRGR